MGVLNVAWIHTQHTLVSIRTHMHMHAHTRTRTHVHSLSVWFGEARTTECSECTRARVRVCVCVACVRMPTSLCCVFLCLSLICSLSLSRALCLTRSIASCSLSLSLSLSPSRSLSPFRCLIARVSILSTSSPLFSARARPVGGGQSTPHHTRHATLTRAELGTQPCAARGLSDLVE